MSVFHIWHMSSVCVICVVICEVLWCVFGLYVVYVWSVYGICVVCDRRCAWCICDVCSCGMHVCVLLVYVSCVC